MATPFAQRLLERRPRQEDPHAIPADPGERDGRFSSLAVG
jgi:hypothetical protein